MSCSPLRLKYCQIVNIFCHRRFSTEQAAIHQLVETVRNDIESNRIKVRKHPGILKFGTCSLPEHIVKAITVVTEEHPIKSIINDAKMLTNYLFSRHYPWEDEDLKERKSNFSEDVKSRMGPLPLDASEEQVRHYNSLVSTSVGYLMQKYQYKWSALDLHEYSCIVYLFTRAAANYAAVTRVFHEISCACPDYKPVSLFDFGSGLGTVSWSAKHLWGDSLKEVVNIDSSGSMNDLASLLLRGGDREATDPLGVYYRQYLPAQHTKYSMVVSAHSLMEMPSREARLNLLLNLWYKTKDFLVIVEQGTKPGFKVVLEARDFILSLAKENSPAHVFAPCPHDKPCPRFQKGPYPCHFMIPYYDLSVGKRETIRKELLSFVVIKKGRKQEEEEWPRVVRPVLKRHNHVICRMCTANGDLEEVIFTKNKHTKELYKCAKATKWGDKLPLKLPAGSTTNIADQKSETSQVEAKPD